MPTLTSEHAGFFKPDHNQPRRQFDEPELPLFGESLRQQQRQPPTEKQLQALIEGWDAELGDGIIKSLERRGVLFHDAEDAKQEALRKASQCLSKRGKPRSVRGWLLKIAGNVVKDDRKKRSRQRKRGREIVESGMIRTAVDPVAERQREADERMIAAMMAAISLLPDELREVAERHCKGWNNREIAKALGISGKTVGNRLDKIRQHLFQHLKVVARDLLP